jgi:arylsulfatase A-like enzyme
VTRHFLYFHHLQNRALRAGRWKLVSKGGSKGPEGAWELYNLEKDRSESKDLARRYPALVKKLASIWERAEAEFRLQAGSGGN